MKPHSNLIRWLSLAWTQRKAMLIALVALFIGLGFTAAGVLWQQSNLDAAAQAQFFNQADAMKRDVLRRLTLGEFGLKGLRGTYAARRTVNQSEFRAYVESRDLKKEFPGIQGLGLVQRVLRGDLDRFAADVQADNDPDFAVHTSGASADLWVVRFIEPIAKNQSLRGLDIGQDAVRREAAERAVMTGEPALTGKILLENRDHQTPGFLLFVPFFKPGLDRATPAQRSTALLGLGFAPIMASELLDGVLDSGDSLLEFDLYEGLERNPQQWLYGSRGPPGSRAAPTLAKFAVQRTLDAAGSILSLHVRSTPSYESQQDRSSLALATLLGVASSGLLALAVWLLASGHARAHQLAQSLTADLDRLARVVQHTNNAVVISDAQHHITWVNAGFSRLTGYSLEHALGKTPSELLSSGKAPLEVLYKLDQATSRGEPCRFQILNRSKDGREYWADTELQPIRDVQGGLVGFMEIGTDITDRMNDQQKIAELSDRMTLAIEGGSDGLWDWMDITQDPQWWSPGYHAMLGYLPHELKPSVSSHRAIMHPDFAEQSRSMLSAALAGGAPYDFELQLRTKEAGYRWFRMRAKVFIDAQGKANRMAGATQDIHDRKMAEAAVLKSSQRFVLAADSAGIGVWEWELDTRVLTWDAQMYHLYRRTPQTDTPALEVLMESLHPDDKMRFESELQQIIRNDKALGGDYRIVWPSGEVRHVRAAARAARDASGRAVRLIGVNFDITELKRAQEALAESEAFLDRAGRIAGVGGWRVDLKDSSIHWSQETRRIHEVADDFVPKIEEAIHFYAPDAQPVIEAAIERAIATGASWDLELPLVTAKGRSIWVRAVGEVEFEDGKPVMLVGAFQNISERRAREQELHLLESCIARISDGVLITSAHTLDEPGPAIVFVNPALERISGYSAQEFLGHTPRILQGPDSDPAALARIRQALQKGEAISEELLNYTKAGVPYWISITISPVFSPGGDLTHFVSVERDVTERRRQDTTLRHALASAERAEQEVRHSQVLLSSSIEALDDAFVLYDAEDRLVLCNHRYREFYPLAAEMLVPGNRFEDIIRFAARRGQYSEAVGRIDDWVLERMAQHNQFHSRLQQRLASGRIVRVVERRTEAGYSVGFRVDITDLVTATETAQEGSRSKSQFLANMSHEIRTPMNAILGMLKLLQNTELTPRQNDYAGKTEAAARSLLGLLNDILDFSKVEAGKMTLDPRPFRPEQMLRDLSVILSTNLGQKNIEILFDIDPKLPPVLVADDMRLQQVLLNLAGNAIKFTSEGEVMLRLRVLERDMDTVVVEFTVQDSGIGIAPENQQHIFSGFSQAEANTTRRFGGTGLGLAISSRLTSLLGGELRLHSVLGQGSTFSFQIRFTLADTLENPGRLPVDTALDVANRGMRVLVVDDYPQTRDILVNMGRSLGWKVDSAATGQQALVRVQQAVSSGEPFTCIFLDWVMPEMDGWETARAIRAEPSFTADGAGVSGMQRPLLIMVTAYGRDMLDQRSAGDQALLDGFMVKPVTAAMLSEAVLEAQAVNLAAATGLQALIHLPAVKSKRLLGMRILVVEDNKINQMVAQGLLSDEGALITLADDGALGVQALTHAVIPFDAVLMDLQMPVMDGYTATRILRTDLRLTDLPVIAMTANVMDSDRIACLAAGMNDHVGKPFDLDSLVAILLRLGRPSGLSTKTPKLAVQAQSTSTDFNATAALERFGGNAAMLGNVLKSFAADLPQFPSRLAGSLSTGVVPEVQRILHTLKGLASTVDARHLAQVAAQLEERCKSALPRAEHAQIVTVLQRAIEATLHDVAPALALYAAPQTAPDYSAAPSEGELHAFRTDLRLLAALLENNDMQALDVHARIRTIYRQALGPAIVSLDQAMDGLEFAKALACCQALLAA